MDDLGWDPTGETRVSKPPGDSGLRIEVPPGKYRVGRGWTYQNLTDWGLEGMGDDPSEVRFVAEKGYNGVLFNIRGGDWALSNFTLAQRKDWETALGLRCFGDDWLLSGVHYSGWRPDEFQGTTTALTAWVMDPEGTGYVHDFYADDATSLVDYPRNAICLFSGAESVGTLYVLDSTLQNSGEHAIYASRTTGDVRVERCTFRNNQNTQVRISGDGSYCKDSLFLWEDHPNVGGFQAQTGLTFEGGFQGYAGGLAENCTFVCERTAPNSGVIKVDGSNGGVTIRDCRIYVASGARTPAINIEVPGDSHMIDGLPDKPWDVELDGVHVVHDGGQLYQHDAAVAIRGRDATLHDTCINSRGGSLYGLRHEDGNIRFTGSCAVESASGTRRYVGDNSGSVGWSDVASTAACTTATKTLPDPITMPEPDPTPGPDPTTPSYAHHANIRAAPDAPGTWYTLTTTGPIGLVATGEFPATPPASEGGPGETVSENPDGTWTARGIVAKGGGDTFEFDGEVVDFIHDGMPGYDEAITLYVDGQPWTRPADPEPEPEPEPEPTPEPEPEPEQPVNIREIAESQGWRWEQITQDVVVLVQPADPGENV